MSKHPDGQLASSDTLVSNAEPPTIHPVLFESIDAAAIKKTQHYTLKEPLVLQALMQEDEGGYVLLSIQPQMTNATHLHVLPGAYTESM